MSLNVAQYLAPLNSGQVLTGYTQGVKQGTGVSIATDGTISLNPAGATTLGFLTSSTAPAPIYNWSLTPGAGGSLLRNDGSGNVNWTNDYVVVYPQGGTSIQTGAAALPAGTTPARPAGALAGWIRYNTTNGNPEFFNGGGWIATTPPNGPVLSFVSGTTPTASNPGDLWLDTNTNQEKVWNGSTWVPTSPPATPIIPGLVTTGANVQNTGGLISILDSTTLQKGVVQLNDTTTTNDPTLALTAAQGYSLQQQINALVISNNLTLAGLISGAGVMTYVTPEGALTGFVLGNPLPAPGPSNDEYFVICESNGGFVPPGGSFTVVTQGDWFLSSGGVWVFLNVGADIPVASTTVAGIVRLSTNAETQTGTDSTIAVTPASLSSRVATEVLSGLAEIATQAEANALVNDSNFITPLKLAGILSSGSITASNILVSPSINGLTNVDSVLRNAIYNIVSGNSSITVSETAIGQIDITVAQATEVQIGGAEVATQAEANAGVNDATIITPLKLANVFASGSIDANDITLNPTINGNATVQQALGNAVYNVASSDNSIVIVETAVGQVDATVRQATETQLGGGQIATQAETETGTLDTVLVTPLKLRTAAVYKSDYNAKGDILSASANDTPLIISVGADGTFLVADSTTATGLKWGSPAPSYIANLDDISGSFDGVTTSFPLTIASVAYAPTPTSNIMVFIGGVAQTPGATQAYTITGTNISFVSAPPTGASFYATTVRN